MGSLRDEIKAIDDRVAEKQAALQEESNGSNKLGLTIRTEFEGAWEALRVIADRVDRLEARTPPDPR